MPTKSARTRPNFVVLTRRKACPADITGRLERALERLDQATVEWQAGRREEAIRLLEEAIRIEEACLGADSAAVATALPQLGAYLLMAGRLEEAEAALARGIALLAAYPVREKERIAAHALLAELHLKTSRFAEAGRTLGALVPDGEREFGPESVEVVRLLHALGQAAEGEGDFPRAAGVYARALVICEAGPDPERLGAMLPPVLGCLVRVSFAMGQNDRAVEYLDRLLLALPEDEAPAELETFDGPDADA